MAGEWPHLPAYQSEGDATDAAPSGWAVQQIDSLFDKLPIGKRFDQKSSFPSGRFPVVDQSRDGYVGFHDEAAGVEASIAAPVVTFANHTCEMRVMRRPFSVIQNVFPMIGKRGVCDSLFFYYATKGRVHLEEYKGHYPDYRRLWIPLPPLPEQKRIAHVLGTLDDKIELNRRMNATLEGISRAIFKSWFVDFDPVRQKAAGKQPVGMDAQTAALFPDSFEDSEIGEVPKGWGIAEVRDFLSLTRESVDPAECPAETFDHYSIPAFDAGCWPSPDLGDAIKSQKLVVPPGCVLISKLNPRTPRVWIPQATSERRRIASTEFLVAMPVETKGVGIPYLFCFALSDSVVDYLASHASGTSNSHQRVRPDDFLTYRVALPPADVLLAFDRAAGPPLRKACQSRRESRTLAALRDTLLPKLLSGETRVPEVIGATDG